MADSPARNVLSPENPAGEMSVKPRTVVLLTCLAMLSACGSAQKGGNASPVAIADVPSTAGSFGKVILDGSGSTDADGTITGYRWQQVSGPTVTIVGDADPSAYFIAPELDGTVRVSLVVTDDHGATAGAEAEIEIVEARGDQLEVEFVSVQLATRLAEGGHTDHSILLDSPRANTTLLMQASLSGVPDDGVAFSIVDESGAQLQVAPLELISNPAVQPATYAGEITVPAQPFLIRATGQSRTGDNFTITSAERFIPTLINAEFEPTSLAGPAGAALPFKLKITNTGAADQFTVHFEDPANLLPPTADIVRSLSAGESVAIDLQAVVPSTLAANETLVARITTGAGDSASFQLLVWQELVP